ncbi:uncharacterized protein LOC133189920 [Saccostrea echinata]|uniref:uncharacterized protein LOC133189920 n=1 Tax=Saccostrea echinata TaxID=191078 RepID=UPI002A8216FB|nr:uncharacterized protein LOC133189920 [Saccostrea echinata]
MSADDASLQFPLHLSTEDEEFVIEKDGDDVTSPSAPQFDDQGFLTSDDQIGGVRLKRRRRCGQCGPCQVKENCNKCHYCVRKDVLKQTCVYRKCVYLRSKPKPYSRQPKEVVPLSQRPLINSPPNDTPRPTSQQVTTPLFPDNNGLAKTLMPNNTVSSPPLPFPFGLPPVPAQTESKFKPPSTVAPDIFSNTNELKSPNAMSSLPGPMNNHQSSLLPSLANNSICAPLSDFSSSSFPRPPIHVPLPHSIRESPSIMHYPGYVRPMVNEPRPEVQSPCMYSPPSLRPPLPSSVSPMNMSFDRNPVGYLDRPPNGPTYFPNSSDLYRPFTSIPSATPGYPYSTQSRFTHNPAAYPSAPSLPGYSGLGMHPPLHPSAMPGNGPHYGAFQTPSFPSNQSIGCPKNGQCPPASQILDTQLMQERYGSTPNSKDNVSSKSDKKTKGSHKHRKADEMELAERTRNIFNLADRRRQNVLSSDYWDFLSRKDRHKLALPAAPGYCANMPWDMFNIYNWSRRPASVLSDDTSHASVTSSEFECDIIGIDDLQINAMIRSDGCNSIEIEFDGRASETSGLSGKAWDQGSSQESENGAECSTPVKKKKVYIEGSVHLRQDLGEEGIIQLELPGNKVTIEDSYLDDELASYSSDIDGLLQFISKEPDLEYLN